MSNFLHGAGNDCLQQKHAHTHTHTHTHIHANGMQTIRASIVLDPAICRSGVAAAVAVVAVAVVAVAAVTATNTQATIGSYKSRCNYGRVQPFSIHFAPKPVTFVV